MRHIHELFLDAVNEERQQTASRRALLSTGAKLAGGGALAVMATTSPAALGLRSALAQRGRADVDILNFALTLEHLENAFYRDGLAALGDPSGTGLLFDIAAHEAAHVETLIAVVSQLGGEPVAEAECYAFDFSSGAAFLETARILENTGVRAYDGAIALIKSPDLQTAGATIATVEARHASFLNYILGFNPFPAAFDEATPPDAILAEAAGFFC